MSGGILRSAVVARRKIQKFTASFVPWPRNSAGRAGTTIASIPMPEHLVVLVHGLGGFLPLSLFLHIRSLFPSYFATGTAGGSPDDLAYLKWCVQIRSQGHMLIHSAKCNDQMRTFDGIEEGGERLADEVSRLVKENPTLTTISFVGNSLGGLYARYAAARLFESESSTICGLKPSTFLTTATPHLGVGPFGYLGMIPDPLKRFLGAKAMGKTVKELLLLDSSEQSDKSEPLLVTMARPNAETPFVRALASFQRRCIYANVVNDAMVAYETAAQEPQPNDVTSRYKQRKLRLRNSPEILHVREKEAQELPGGELPETDSAHEKIAAGLSSLSWREVAVAFPGMLPTAHNKICALQRDPILAWMNKEGEAIVQHQADYLVEPIVAKYVETSLEVDKQSGSDGEQFVESPSESPSSSRVSGR